MKVRMLPVTTIASFVLFSEPQMVTAEPPLPDSTFHALPLRLDEPRWKPLSGEQIKALLSDRTVKIDTEYEPAPGLKINVIYRGGCPPYETFRANGHWQRGECQRAYRVYEGRWMTEPFRGGERLCVEAVGYPKACRFVWQGSTADQIVMPLATPADTDAPDEHCFGQAFSPYRITHRQNR